MSKVIISIDPGSMGAVVKRRGDVIEEIYCVEKIGDKIDYLELAKNFKELVKGEDNVTIIVEDVHSIHGSSAKGNFNFGKIVGFLEGLIYMSNVKFVKVPPKTWQKLMYVGVPIQKDIKDMSVYAAKMLFPTVSLKRTQRSRKDDDNISDALLIGEYAVRKNL